MRDRRTSASNGEHLCMKSLASFSQKRMRAEDRHEHKTNKEMRNQKAHMHADRDCTQTDTVRLEEGEERVQIPGEGERKIIQKREWSSA